MDFFCLFSVIDCTGLWSLDGKSLQEYPNPVDVGVPQSSILGYILFLPYINDLPDVFCNIAMYPDGIALYSLL